VIAYTAASSGNAFGKESQQAWILEISGAIGPATSDLINRTLDDATEKNCALLVLKMDTPGGLSKSMRVIIKRILSSPVPVVTYVAPNGARAASAGTYILYASHIAAMAPATNLGAATPVQIGAPQSPQPLPTGDHKNKSTKDTLKTKQLNDAIAYIRGLAALRNRNVDWAEEAVREAASITASKALEINVIDIIATDIEDLFFQIEGRKVRLNGQSVTINAKDLQRITLQPDWRNKFLSVITNPNIAYLLMMIGIYGLILEFYNPGMGLPGIVGAICLLLGLYALHLLPVSYVGIALILLGVMLMVTEAFVPSFGVLGVGGIIAFIIGSTLLIDTNIPVFRVAIPFIGSLALVSFLLLVLLLNLMLRSRHQKVVSGIEILIGQHALVVDDFEEEGLVTLEGELWNAKSKHPLKKGSLVIIAAVSGLTLTVKSDQEK